MKRICAWCKKELVSKSGGTGEITHSICDECMDYFYVNPNKNLKDLLNSLVAPVLAIDEEGRVITLNNKAQKIISKKRGDIEGKLGGDVFECIYARLPGGCGHTTHCKSCTIRNTVTDTFNTGISQQKVPAYPDLETPEGPKQIRFLISTEKVDNIVLLRIDEIG